jgi:hypothetical protein
MSCTKPFGLPQIKAFGHVALDLGLWLATLVVAAGVGWRLTSRWAGLTPVERLVFGVGLGFAALGYSMMALGLLGWLHPLTLAAVGGGLLLWQVMRPQSARAAWQTARSAVPQPRGRFRVAAGGSDAGLPCPGVAVGAGRRPTLSTPWSTICGR